MVGNYNNQKKYEACVISSWKSPVAKNSRTSELVCELPHKPLLLSFQAHETFEAMPAPKEKPYDDARLQGQSSQDNRQTIGVEQVGKQIKREIDSNSCNCPYQMAEGISSRLRVLAQLVARRKKFSRLSD